MALTLIFSGIRNDQLSMVINLYTKIKSGPSCLQFGQCAVLYTYINPEFTILLMT